MITHTMNVKSLANAVRSLLLLSILFFTLTGRSCAGEAPAGAVSVSTSLNAGSCKEEIDDQTGIPFLVCSGVEGYKLIVRDVESGRQSIDILDSAGRIFPLDYQEVVTRSWSHLGDKAEWRVMVREGKKVPMALIVPVHVHEDSDSPERVTHTYFAVAKITPDQLCVTDRILEEPRSRSQVLRVAGIAPGKPCLSALPPRQD